MPQRHVIVSPHHDDAVLSCHHLAHRNVLVINVFDALPDPDAPMTEWDLRTGSTSARERMVERYVEDAGAMRQCGWSATGLGLYRPTSTSDQISERVRGLLREGDTVWLPAGIGGHPGHLLVRDALCDLAASHDLRLYADMPYAVGHGFSMPASGQIPAFWRQAIDDAPTQVGELHLIRLDELHTSEKAHAVALYATQVRELDREHDGALSDPERLGLEAWWPVSLK
jgi:hypothetical protein